MVQEGISLQEMNDNPERLLQLQEVLYPLINTTLQTANCNGAYAILDATANTALAVADHSRSGIHLRLLQPQCQQPGYPYRVYFRGIPDIAREKDLELHNRWNLDFDTDQIPGCRELMDTPLDRSAQRYFWSRRIDLKDTWESAMLLCVPIVAAMGPYRRLWCRTQCIVFSVILSYSRWAVRLCCYCAGAHSGQPSPVVGWTGWQCQRHLLGWSGDACHPSGAIL